MKIYKRYATALKAAAGRPIVRVGSAYVVGDVTVATSIELIAPSGGIAATVTCRHLNRLGNANWATPGRNLFYDAFQPTR